MSDTPKRDLSAIGQEILFAARNELYMNLPYLDVVLCALEFKSGEEKTVSLATDGKALYYDGAYLAERFLRGRTAVNRAYLHSVLHCMLRHLWKKKGKAPELWDLACDAAVESILDDLQYPCIRETCEVAQRENRRIDPLLRGRWTLNGQLEKVNLVSAGTAVARDQAFVAKNRR